MRARQKAKNLKKKIKVLESDNDLMYKIINGTPSMQELYNLYNEPLNITNTTMQFQEYRVKRMIPIHTTDTYGVVAYTKQEMLRDLFDGIKDNIIYDVDNEQNAITASIFVGRKENKKNETQV